MDNKKDEVPDWATRARATKSYYVQSVKDNPHYTLRDMAKELKRSLGSIAQDLMLASFLLTHEVKLLKYKTAKDALEFCRKIKAEQRLHE